MTVYCRVPLSPRASMACSASILPRRLWPGVNGSVETAVGVRLLELDSGSARAELAQPDVRITLDSAGSSDAHAAHVEAYTRAAWSCSAGDSTWSGELRDRLAPIALDHRGAAGPGPDVEHDALHPGVAIRHRSWCSEAGRARVRRRPTSASPIVRPQLGRVPPPGQGAEPPGLPALERPLTGRWSTSHRPGCPSLKRSRLGPALRGG